MRASEVTGNLFGGVFALSVAYQENPLLIDTAQAAEHRRVVPESFVTVKFDEISDDGVDDIGGQGALGMPRQLDLLPGSQAAEDSPFLFVALGYEFFDLT